MNIFTRKAISLTYKGVLIAIFFFLYYTSQSGSKNIIYSHVLVSLAYSRRSDSGVWLEVRESEGRKELGSKRGRERKKGTLSLPITHPLLFSCSHLLAQSPQSERLDHQAIIIIYYSFKIFPQF